MLGRVHSFQSLGTVDGPGVRSVVFLQGCGLRCPYCHNPDTWDMHGGEEVTAQDIFQKVCRYRAYFGEKGGVTVSGGEPLLQAEFVTELFTLCKEAGISTALDTSGVRLDDTVRRLLNVTDIVLLDIKFSDDAKYRQYIGIPLVQILDFLREADKLQKHIILRQVIVPGVNDTPEDVRALGEIAKQFSCVRKIELLPFMKLCAEKYETMGIPFQFGDKPEATGELIERLSAELPKLPL